MGVVHPFHLGETEAPKRGGDLPLGFRVSQSFWGRVFSWCSCTWCGFLWDESLCLATSQP